MRQSTLFDDSRLSLSQAIDLFAESICHYGAHYKHWAIAFSGGKDSSTVLTLVLALLDQGRIPRPESITVLYADTRQELPPLHFSAMQLLEEARKRGCKTRIVCAEMDKRFWVYILGRGVPSPNNGTLRWCTEAIKVAPMEHDLEALYESIPGNIPVATLDEHAKKICKREKWKISALTTEQLYAIREECDREFGPQTPVLMLTGVRKGESAVRDQRIAVSCSKDGGECSQGWFQSMTSPITDTLAPILHFRLCHVWDWLVEAEFEYGFPTSGIAYAYGLHSSENDEPIAARTGCIGCPLTDNDDALDRVVATPEWAYLASLKRIKQIHREIRQGQNRHRQPGTRLLKNGQHESNPMRLGPLSLEKRLYFLEQVLDIQSEVNKQAIALSRPTISLINAEEEARIRELIDLKTFPDGWTGDEPMGDELLPEIYPNGSIQPLLFALVGD